MSTVEQPPRRTLPPLVAGQRLDQPTFHERYEAMPPGTKAELVGGIVYMPSPMSYEHSEADDCAAGWIFNYRASTPGLKGGGGATTKLGPFGEVQPDRQIRIPQELGGQSRIIDNYVTGAPEFIFEVSKSSLAYDLGEKLADYEGAGVLEYVVAALDDREVHWFTRRDRRFEAHPAGPDGIFRSPAFPGLWLEPNAFFDDDLPRLMAVLNQGLATPEHAAFVARLAEARRAGP